MAARGGRLNDHRIDFSFSRRGKKNGQILYHIYPETKVIMFGLLRVCSTTPLHCLGIIGLFPAAFWLVTLT